jgi:hypothetical protein
VQDLNATLLSDLQGRWVGEGINTLWVPTPVAAGVPTPPAQVYSPPVPDQQPRPLPQFVSSRTTETLVVGDVLGSVPNKGAHEAFGELAAPYEQRVHDENGTLIHVENGFWLITPPSDAASPPPEPRPASVAKLSSIPHGTVAIVQGDLPVRQNGKVQISASDVPTTPVMPGIVPPQLTKPPGPLAQEYIDNVASYIVQRIAADCTGLLWELKLATSTTTAGVANIDFINANAAVKSIQSTVWIGNLGIRTDETGAQTASVLAYVQTAILTFDNVDWPHVSVGYLTKDMDPGVAATR